VLARHWAATQPALLVQRNDVGQDALGLARSTPGKDGARAELLQILQAASSSSSALVASDQAISKSTRLG
jgi:hypothetical protein